MVGDVYPYLSDQASQVWDKIDSWDKFGQANHPDIWEQYKLKPIEAQVNLESAYSGSFHVAMGDLAPFLAAVGAPFEEIYMF
jgi:hypothetical protein